MEVVSTDFNGSAELIADRCAPAWTELESVLESIPLHLKSSGQAGVQGTPVFDPVGTNESIKQTLCAAGWRHSIPIPAEYASLGTDVDFARGCVLAEVQFSNYPFLLNNTFRSDLFYKAAIVLDDDPVALAIIISKARMFPASNSSL